MVAGAQSIPRAVTCPAFPSPGSSSPGKGRGLPIWRRAPGAAAAIALPRAAGSSRGILAAIGVLYTLVLLGLPLLYSRFGSLNSMQDGNLAAAPARQPDLPQSLARALSSRRVALEGSQVRAGMWPDPSGQLGAAAAAQLPRVEYRDAGNVVSLADALNISQWDELPLYLASTVPGDLQPGGTAAGGIRSERQEREAGKVGSVPAFPAICPQGEIRLFVGITSRCCTAEAQAKRAAIRRTWMRTAKERVPNMDVRFVLAQPDSSTDLHTATELLRGEIAQHADLIIVPGADLYRTLPGKTLHLLRYALSSPCRYTHILKTDDDVYLRPQLLMDIIHTGQYNFSVEVQYDGSGRFDGRPAAFFQAPWMSGMYVGQLDSKHPQGYYPGWSPNRDPTSKWHLPAEDLPDELAPLGVRWASGWGYMLSRDLAELIANTAITYTAMPERKPLWWGRMPWEDIMVGAMLSGVARVHHHDGFKAAWQGCGPSTVLKHLDNDAPSLQEGLHAQELSGLWAKKSIVCSSGPFKLNNHTDWRAWRNSLPDTQLGGFM